MKKEFDRLGALYDAAREDEGTFERLKAELSIARRAYATDVVLFLDPFFRWVVKVSPGEWCSREKWETEGGVEYGFDDRGRVVWELDRNWQRVSLWEPNGMLQYEFDSTGCMDRLRRATYEGEELKELWFINYDDSTRYSQYTFDETKRTLREVLVFGTRDCPDTSKRRVHELVYDDKGPCELRELFEDKEPTVKKLKGPALSKGKLRGLLVDTVVQAVTEHGLEGAAAVVIAYDPGTGPSSIVLGVETLEGLQGRSGDDDVLSVWNPAEFSSYDEGALAPDWSLPPEYDDQAGGDDEQQKLLE